MGLQDEIQFLDLQQELRKQPDYPAALARAREEILAEIQDPQNQEHLQALTASSMASLDTSHLPCGMVKRIFTLAEEHLTPNEVIAKSALETRAKAAATQFLIYGRAIAHLDLYTRICPDGVRASVHKGPGRIPIRFHSKGSEILPWMGVAVKEDDEVSIKYVCEVEHDPTYIPVYVRDCCHPLYFVKAQRGVHCSN